MTEQEIANLIVRIDADVRSLKAGLTDAENASKRAGKNVNAFLDTFKGFVSAQAALGLARRGWMELTQYIQGATVEYGKQEQAEAQLTQALGGTSDMLLKQANELQRLTTFADDATIQAQALVAMFVKEEKQVARLTPVIQDFAAAKRMNLASAADLVTKTFASETNALQRYGITVTGAAGSSERMESIVKSLNAAFKGQAEALAKTDFGKLEQQKNLLGDSQEILGKEIIPLQIEWNNLMLNMAESIVPMLSKSIADLRDGGALQTITKWIREDVAGVVRLLEIAVGITKLPGKVGSAIAPMVRNMTAYGQLLNYIEGMDGPDFPEYVPGKKVQPQEKPPAAETDAQKKSRINAAVAREKYALQQQLAELQIPIDALEAEYKADQMAAEKYYAEKSRMITEGAETEIGALLKIRDHKETLADKEEVQSQITLRTIELERELAGLNAEKIQTLKGLTKAQSDYNKQAAIDEEERRKAVAGVFREATGRATKELTGEDYDLQLQDLKNRQKAEIDLLREVGSAKDAAAREDNLRRIHERELEKFHHDYMQNLALKRLDIASQTVSNLTAAVDTYYSYAKEIYDAELEDLDRKQQREFDILAASDASRAELRELSAKQEEERNDAKVSGAAKAARALFYIEKALALSEAIINGASATIKAYSVDPYGILAGAVALATGAQAGLIAGQMIAGPGLAEGGQVDGPPGRDVIPARLTRKEFVQPVPAVEYYGKGVMEAIRRRAIPRGLLAGFGVPATYRPKIGYADGGAVVGGGSAAGSPGEPQNINIANFVDPQLFSQYVASVPGSRAIINVLARNSYEVRRAIFRNG